MSGRILVNTSDGQWETLGTDRDPGNEPYGILPTYNEWGPDTLTFNIRRDPALEHPDLDAYAPILYYPDSLDRPTWAGRLLERPGTDETDPSIAGQARGWQYHLDDDLYRRLHVHSDLSAWQDVRGLPGVDLNTWTVGPQVQTGAGEIPIAWPAAGPITTGKAAGVYFDAGPDAGNWPVRVTLEFEILGGAANANNTIIIRPFDALPVDATADVTRAGNLGGGTITSALVARRFVTVFFYRNGASFSPLAGDEGIRIKRLLLYRVASFESGGLSTVRVSDLIRDAIPVAPLLAQDESLITDTVLTLNHASWEKEPQTPREVMARWNTYHGYVLKLAGRNLDTIQFKPQAARARLRLDTGQPGARFADASTSSGADLHNRVIVTGRSGSGAELSVTRNAPLVYVIDPQTPQPVNPSFTADAAGWTAASGTITRDTGTLHSAPASGLLSATAAPDVNARAETVLTGLRAGGAYQVTVWLTPATSLGLCQVRIDSGGPLLLAQAGGPTTPAGWTAVTVAFTADKTTATLQIVAQRNTNGPAVYIDDVSIARAMGNIIDRRFFTRTKVLTIDSPTDPAAMAALGDAWLALHATSPLKGSLTVTSDTAVTEIATGRPVGLEELGLYAGELVLIANLVDPDTGGQGRVGKIAAVSVTDDAASLTIDNERTAFEALLARMGIVGAVAPVR